MTSRTPPARPTAAELAHDPARLWHWMDAYSDHTMLEAFEELRQERQRDRERLRLVVDNTKRER